MPEGSAEKTCWATALVLRLPLCRMFYIRPVSASKLTLSSAPQLCTKTQICRGTTRRGRPTKVSAKMGQLYIKCSFLIQKEEDKLCAQRSAGSLTCCHISLSWVLLISHKITCFNTVPLVCIASKIQVDQHIVYVQYIFNYF